jgi:Spy/CpxP family protein refolding chaperone
MTFRYKLSAIVATVVMTASLLVAAQIRGGAAGMGPWSGQRFQELAAYLNLTSQETAAIQGIMQDAATQAQPLVSQMQQVHQDIANLVKTANPIAPDFATNVKNLATQQANLQSQLMVIRVTAMTKAAAVLTPDQRTKAEQLFELMRPGFGGAGMAGHMRHGQ